MKRKRIKYSKRIIPVILLFCINSVYGQWSFDYSINPMGIGCAKLGYKGARNALGNPRTNGFSTKQECEQHRQQLAGKTVRASGDCTIKVECKPCTGSDSPSGSSSNSGKNPNTSLETVTSTYRPIHVNTDVDFNAIYNQNGNNELLFADNVKKSVQNTPSGVVTVAGNTTGKNFMGNLQKHKQENEGFDLNTVMTPRKDYPYLPNYAADAIKKEVQRESRPIENQKIEYKTPVIDLAAGTAKTIIGLAGTAEALIAIPTINIWKENAKVIKSMWTGEYYDITTKEMLYNAFWDNGEVPTEVVETLLGAGITKAGKMHLVKNAKDYGVVPIRAVKNLNRLDDAVTFWGVGWDWGSQIGEDYINSQQNKNK